MKRPLHLARNFSYADWLGCAIAVAFFSLTIVYPFGRDQGLYHYVGREWFNGALPYRDVMDQKTPVIYLLYGFAYAVFGEHMWAIRLLELVWVFVMGGLLARAVAPRGEPVATGVRGATTLGLCILYFGVLGFWDTAQCEVWYVGLAIASLAVVRQDPHRVRAPLLAGLFAGLACLAKPPAVFVVMIPTSVLVLQAWAREQSMAARVRAVLFDASLFAAAALLPLLLVIARFAAAGALDDLYDVVVRCNAYYREHEVANNASLDLMRESLIGHWRHIFPISLLSLLAVVLGLYAGLRLKDRDLIVRYLIAAAFPVCACMGVIVQRMYFAYHWGAAYLCWAVPLAFAVDDLVRRGPALLKRPVAPATFAAAWIGVLVFCYAGAGNHMAFHLQSMSFNLDYLLGRVGRKEYGEHYMIPGWYDFPANVAIGDWLREHSRPDQLVAVRSFEPAIYAISERTSKLRFFWTTWITNDRRAYRRKAWLAQDRAQLAANPPDFAIVLDGYREGPDSAAYLAPYGTYLERFRAGQFVVIERVSPPH